MRLYVRVYTNMNTTYFQTIVYKNNSYRLVAGYDRGYRKTSYYFCFENNTLLHVNSIHDIVFLEQTIDFPDYINTERQKTHYITSRSGMARNSPESIDSEILVYSDNKNHFYLYHDRVIHYVNTPAVATRVDEYAIDYTERDNLQTSFDCARLLARIVAQIDRNKIKRKNFPSFT